jgi:hypothetical protein
MGDEKYCVSTQNIVFIVNENSDGETLSEKTTTSLSIHTVAHNNDDNERTRYQVGYTVWLKGTLNPAVEEASFSYRLIYPDDTTKDGIFNETTQSFGKKSIFPNYQEGKIVVYIYEIESNSLAGEYTVQAEYNGDSQHSASSDVTTFTIEPGLGSAPKPCIIATAAYGSQMHVHVQQMRTFRDEKVRNSFSGDNFVEVFLLWYYSWSPLVANVISQNEILKGFFRILLLPLVYTMRVSEIVFDLLAFLPELASSISILCSAMLCGVFYIAPLMVFLYTIGVKTASYMKNLNYIALISLVLAVLGSMYKLVILNTLGFVVLTITITYYIGSKITQITVRLYNR